METILTLPPQVTALIFYHQSCCSSTSDPLSPHYLDEPLPLQLFKKTGSVASCYYFTIRLGEVCKAWRNGILNADAVWSQLCLLFNVTVTKYQTLIPVPSFHRNVLEEAARAEIHATISFERQSSILKQWQLDNPNPCSTSEESTPIHPLFEVGTGDYSPPLPRPVAERICANLDTLLFLLETVSRQLKPLDAAARKAWRKQAKIRYRRFRLLKQEHPGLLLLPTLDIEFVWVAHLLHTETYWSDTLGLPHQIVASPGHILLRLASLQLTAKLWESAFGEPYLTPGQPNPTQHIFTPRAGTSYWGPKGLPDFTPPAAFLESEGNMQSRKLSKEEKEKAPLGIRCPDLSQLLRWLKPVQQVLNLVTRSEDEIYAPGHSVCAYQRFLFLAARFPKARLEASYFVDASWHAHQLNPVEYRQEVELATGRFLKHNSKGDNEKDDGNNNSSASETETLWEKTFGLPLDREPQYADPDIPSRPWLAYEGVRPNFSASSESPDGMVALAWDQSSSGDES